jgi:hypothetical protein
MFQTFCTPLYQASTSRVYPPQPPFSPRCAVAQARSPHERHACAIDSNHCLLSNAIDSNHCLLSNTIDSNHCLLSNTIDSNHCLLSNTFDSNHCLLSNCRGRQPPPANGAPRLHPAIFSTGSNYPSPNHQSLDPRSIPTNHQSPIIILLRILCEGPERVNVMRHRNTPVAEQGAALVDVKVLIAIRGGLPGDVAKPVAPAKM